MKDVAELSSLVTRRFILMQYLHTLIFACPNCYQPVAFTQISPHKRLEDLAAEILTIQCLKCGAVSKVQGSTATHGYVGPWKLADANLER
jgi:RNase P subunit RPR2